MEAFPQSGSGTFSPVEIVTSTGERVAADTGWVTVPERHGAPGGTSVRLPVLRLRSTSPRPGLPIVYLAGGPGNAGIPRGRDYSPLLLALRAVGDVILYDQRGTGRAVPSLALAGTLDLPKDVAVDAPAARERLVAWARDAAREARARGIDLAAYNTVESAHDLDAIRSALGAERWIVWGHSYGSHLGLAYLRAYPQRVARFMIGGVNGTDHRWRPPTDGDVLLARIDSAIKADPRWQRAMPDFMGTMRRVLSRLEARPESAELDGQRYVLGRQDLAVAIALLGGEISFIERVPYIMAHLDTGNAVPLARNAVPVLRNRASGTAMTYAMHIASGVSTARARRIAVDSATALLRDAINFPWDVEGFTTAFGIPDLGDAFRSPVRSDVPTLVYSGTFDGRTSLEDAEEVRRSLRNSVHVVVDGASHSPHLQSAELRQLMLDFASGKAVRSQHLSVPLEFHGPDEPFLMGELATAAQRDGVVAAATLLRGMASRSDAILTSFVPRPLASTLLANKRFDEAAEFLRVAVELFPGTSYLFDQLGQAYDGAGDAAQALAAYRRAVELDAFALRAARRVGQLTVKQ